ncbi:MAG: hypothetical protein JSW57_02575 [Flavobacteriaceae bacterium]|nr:MAG: hypothetical protein JSW57_02575 [Flavobacteriaceae bacterium]
MPFRFGQRTILLIGSLFLSLSPALYSQNETPKANRREHSILDSDRDITYGGLHDLKELFGLGTITGHVRNYFMNTINKGDLSDFYANAIGGAMRFRSHEFYGFEFGAAGIFTYKMFSSDLNAADPTTGRISRWEHELFDVLDLNNFNDLDRLEELYVRYNFTRGNVTYGKLAIEDTPLKNRSDDRMKPFAFKGIWLNYAPEVHHRLQGAWIDRISPRGTVEWFDFKEGIGLFDQGFQPDGSEAEYHDHLESEGLAMLGYLGHFEKFNVELYQFYIHHMSYISWAGLEYHKNGWNVGLQYSISFPDAFQKELEYGQRYMQPGERGQVLSGRVRYHFGAWDLWGAYTHAFDTGRFLFPRELGRDHFYTSLPRSRLEGLGNADVVTFGAQLHFGGEHFTADAAYTRLFGPEVDSFEFNKYNLDSYQQVNFSLEYAFTGFLEGLHMTFLYIYKNNLNNTAPEVIFNESNYHQLNFVTNFEF